MNELILIMRADIEEYYEMLTYVFKIQIIYIGTNMRVPWHEAVRIVTSPRT